MRHVEDDEQVTALLSSEKRSFVMREALFYSFARVAARPMPQPINSDAIVRDEKTFARVGRRELLRVAPVLLAGAIAFPKVRSALFSDGLTFTDWASAKWFRQDHAVPAYANADLTPLAQFPLNTYAAEDPELDLDAWRLQVAGMVQRPGEYRLSDLQVLPKTSLNTRHTCVEGLDVVATLPAFAFPSS